MRGLVITVLAAGAAACASSSAIPQPFPVPVATVRPRPGIEVLAPTTRDGYAIAGTALSFRGVPYRNGGSDPSGFDCSGLVWYVFAQHGIALPRTVAEQYQSGDALESSGVRAGDLLFFSTSSGPAGADPSHVGISIGGDEFVHAPSTPGEVRVERLGSAYWAARFIGARRVR